MKHVPITDKGIVTVGLPALKVAGECLATETKDKDVILILLEIFWLLHMIGDEIGWQTSIYWRGSEATAIARSIQGQPTKGDDILAVPRLSVVQMPDLAADGPWSGAETQRLLDLVHRYGAYSLDAWIEISEDLGSRTPLQCKERYLTYYLTYPKRTVSHSVREHTNIQLHNLD